MQEVFLLPGPEVLIMQKVFPPHGAKFLITQKGFPTCGPEVLIMQNGFPPPGLKGRRVPSWPQSSNNPKGSLTCENAKGFFLAPKFLIPKF